MIMRFFQGTEHQQYEVSLAWETGNELPRSKERVLYKVVPCISEPSVVLST